MMHDIENKIKKYRTIAKIDVLLVDISASSHPSVENPVPIHSGLRSVLSYIKKRGVSSELLFNITLPWPSPQIVDFFVREIVRKRPLFLGFSPYQPVIGVDRTNYITEIWKIVRGMHKRGVFPYITFGGHFASFEHRHLMEDFPWIDFVVRGEGEETFNELMVYVKNGRSPDGVNGLTFRKDKDIIENPPRTAITNLDSLPLPVNVHLEYAKRNGISIPISSICSSRGCYGNCSFCSIQSFYKLSPSKVCWRPKSPARVVDEMEIMIKQYGVQYFCFLDDNFLGYGESGRKRATDIAHEILRRRLNIKFRLMCRANDIDAKVMKTLRSAGLYLVLIGVESGSERGLKTYHKNVDIEQNKRGMLIVDELGIQVIPSIILLNPYTDIKELKDNIAFYNFTKSLSNVVWAEQTILSYLQVFSGTPIQKKLTEDGLLLGNYIDGYDYKFREKKMKFIREIVFLFEKYYLNISNLIRTYESNKRLFADDVFVSLHKFKRLLFYEIFIKTIEDAIKVLECRDSQEIRIFIKRYDEQLKKTLSRLRSKLKLLGYASQELLLLLIIEAYINLLAIADE